MVEKNDSLRGWRKWRKWLWNKVVVIFIILIVFYPQWYLLNEGVGWQKMAVVFLASIFVVIVSNLSKFKTLAINKNGIEFKLNDVVERAKNAIEKTELTIDELKKYITPLVEHNLALFQLVHEKELNIDLNEKGKKHLSDGVSNVDIAKKMYYASEKMLDSLNIEREKQNRMMEIGKDSVVLAYKIDIEKYRKEINELNTYSSIQRADSFGFMNNQETAVLKNNWIINYIDLREQANQPNVNGLGAPGAKEKMMELIDELETFMG